MHPLVYAALSYALSNLDDLNEAMGTKFKEKQIRPYLEAAEASRGNPGGLDGRLILSAVALTDEDMANEGWEGQDPPLALELDDGTVIYPSADDEGNSPGRIFGRSKNGQNVRFV